MTDSLLNDNVEDLDIDPTKNYLEDLVGDGKKFKTPEDLAKAKLHSDNYIQHLLKEHDALKEDYTKVLAEARAKANIEDMLDQYTSRRNNDNNEFNLPNDSGNVDTPSLDPKQLETLVSKQILEFNKTEEQRKNFKVVQDKLKEHLGSNYSQLLKQQIESTPGLTVDMVDNLARTSPDAVFNLLGFNQVSPRDINAPRSSVRTDNFSPNTTPKRTRSYYVKMRKDQPALYYDPKTSVQMYKDAQEIPDFFDTED